MLCFTNRITEPRNDAGAFTTRFEPGADRLAMARVTARAGGWVLDDLAADVGDDLVLQALLPLFQGPRAVLVYLHGNDNTPADCFERCERLASLYGVEVIGWSWPSEGFLPDGRSPTAVDIDLPAGEGDRGLAGVDTFNRRQPRTIARIERYQRAKLNGQHGVDALGRFLRLLATARLFANARRCSLAAHSLGAHCLEYTLEVPGAGEALGAMHNIVLLAPCTRAAGHKVWLAKLRPKGQVLVCFNRGDSVLLGASIADGMQDKLGTDPTPDRLHAEPVRYVSFTHARMSLLGHNYFVTSPIQREARRLFGRVFASELDFDPFQGPREAYPVGCDPDGRTCYMAPPDIGGNA